MAKKGNNGKAKTKAGGGKRQIIAVSAIVIITGVVGSFLLAGDGGGSNGPKVLGGETRPVLSSHYFLGKTARAYEVAREIPQVLDKIYCYCRCQDNFGHKSLLTCFTDKHGSQCGICMDEALMAGDLHRKGHKADDIAKKVDNYFSKRKI